MDHSQREKVVKIHLWNSEILVKLRVGRKRSTQHLLWRERKEIYDA